MYTIGIDARFVTRNPRRGIGNYSLCLLKELISLASNFRFILYIYEADREGVLPRTENVTVRRLKTPFYPLWEQISLPLAVHRDRVDILHCLGNTAPLFLPKSCKLILSLMDVMFMHSGDFVPIPTNRYQYIGRIYRKIVVPHVARKASRIITISEYSKHDIANTILRLDPANICVTYLSCDNAFHNVDNTVSLEDISGFNNPYVFALGADDPRKNTLRLVSAYLEVLRKGLCSCDLLISGYADWEKSDAYQLVIKSNATEKIKFLPYVTINQLVTLYQNAVFFIYPSLYEGFGIPILEAFATGCPVIASRVTSIPEVAGKAALYVDPMSQTEIELAITKLANDRALQSLLRDDGYKRAELFTWEETARKTVDIYVECLSDVY